MPECVSRSVRARKCCDCTTTASSTTDALLVRLRMQVRARELRTHDWEFAGASMAERCQRRRDHAQGRRCNNAQGAARQFNRAVHGWAPSVSTAPQPRHLPAIHWRGGPDPDRLERRDRSARILGIGTRHPRPRHDVFRDGLSVTNVVLHCDRAHCLGHHAGGRQTTA